MQESADGNTIPLVAMEIITKPSLAICTFSAMFLSLTPALFADVVLQRVPALTVEQAPGYPQNLARYRLGAQLQVTPTSLPIGKLQLSTQTEDGNAAEAALLCDDPTIGYSLLVGKTTLLVSLPKIENVDTVSFLNTGAKGEVTVATSNVKLAEDDPQWHGALAQQLSSNAVQAAVGPSEAKYVRVTFNVTEPGRIYGFGVYAAAQISDFTAPRQRKLAVQDKSDSFALIAYNLTDIHAKARALYVSSGNDLKQANNMIDGQTNSN